MAEKTPSGAENNDNPSARLTWLGRFYKKGRWSLTALIVALLLAYESFFDFAGKDYSLSSAVVVVAAALWASWVALKKRFLFGLGFLIIAAIWALPLLGVQYFAAEPIFGFLLHAIAALAFAVAGYGYLGIEKRGKENG